LACVVYPILIRGNIQYGDIIITNKYKKMKWTRWAILEGLMKSISRLFQKIVGNVINSWGGTFYAAGIVGLVQVVVSTILISKNKIKFVSKRSDTVGASVFGIIAVISTILGFAIYLKGGDVGTTTFIMTLSIIPGMIIDIIFFKHKSTIAQWVGIFIACFAGWSILGFPLSISSIEIWVWLAILTMILVAINQGVTQSIREINPLQKNFWGGLMAIIISIFALYYFKDNYSYVELSSNNIKLWYTSTAIGFIVIAMWSFNLLSYKSGASIAIKKLVMNASQLIISMGFGFIFFNEPITLWKLLAIPLFIVSFVLIDRK
jgi:drug/metabolite transporter (DMT)-like permease